MNVNVKITVGAQPEVCTAFNNVVTALSNIAVAFSSAAAMHSIDTSAITKPAKAKLPPVTKDVLVIAPAADGSAEPLAAAITATVAAPAAGATTPSAAVPLTADAVKTLAALKAKKVGAAVVKAIIADTGAATIAEIADPLVLASLAANLDAL